MKKVTIMIPAYNESAVLPKLFVELDKLMGRHKEYEWEILFVNDGSKDNTLDIIKEKRQKDARYVMLTYQETLARKERWQQDLTSRQVIAL